MIYFVFQAEDGIRDRDVTGVQTCALPIYTVPCWSQWSHQTAVLFPPAFRYRSPHEDGTPGQGQNHWTRDQHQRLLLRRSSTRSEEHTSELQSHHDLVCRLLLEKKKNTT